MVFCWNVELFPISDMIAGTWSKSGVPSKTLPKIKKNAKKMQKWNGMEKIVPKNMFFQLCTRDHVLNCKEFYTFSNQLCQNYSFSITKTYKMRAISLVRVKTWKWKSHSILRPIPWTPLSGFVQKLVTSRFWIQMEPKGGTMQSIVFQEIMVPN